jgi:hypothetical protein
MKSMCACFNDGHFVHTVHAGLTSKLLSKWLHCMYCISCLSVFALCHCRHAGVYYHGSHKNGCNFAIQASTAPDGQVTATCSGRHHPTCGTHPAARRLHPRVKQYILDVLDFGIEPDRIYKFFHDHTAVRKGECEPAASIARRGDSAALVRGLHFCAAHMTLATLLGGALCQLPSCILLLPRHNVVWVPHAPLVCLHFCSQVCLRLPVPLTALTLAPTPTLRGGFPP